MGADLTSNRVGSRAGASAARAGLGGPSAAISERAGPPAAEACARRRDSPGDRAAAAASPRSTSRGGGFGTTTGPAGVIPTCTKANPFRTSPSDRHVRLGQCMLLSAGWYENDRLTGLARRTAWCTDRLAGAEELSGVGDRVARIRP